MDLGRLVSAVVYAYFIVFTVFGVGNVWVEIALYTALLISVVYAAETTMALANVRLWYNVMVVSVAMALPQTVFAVNLAASGKPIAAWIDTLASTLVDAVFVTAVIRRHIIGSRLVRSTLPYMLIWSILAVGLNLVTYHESLYRSREVMVAYAVGGLLLPVLLIRSFSGWPDKGSVLLLANHALATVVASYMLSSSIMSLPYDEIQLGVISTILATLPDFIVAMLIRGVVSRLISSEAGDEESWYTLLAAATHDQLTIPALILLVRPDAALYYPHLFNIAVVLLKFTLLDRRAFWPGLLIGIGMLLWPPV